MPMEIIDGKGTGNSVEVDNNFRLRTLSVTNSGDQDINAKHNKAWSIPFEGLNPTAANDYVIYIKNTGTNVIHIPSIRVMADTAATQLKIESVTGTAVGGGAITPVNRTVGSSNVPTAIIESSVDITGLTSTGVLFFIQCPTVDKEEKLITPTKIRIPKGQAIAISVETGTANITGVISLIEEV